MGIKGKAHELELEGGGWRLPADAVLDTDERREEYLAPARENHQHILCRCQEPPVAMSVALRRKTNRYYLTPAIRTSKANGSPPKHRTDCRLYHGDKGPSTNDGKALPGVEPHADGTIRVYLSSAGLDDPAAEHQRPPAKTDSESNKQARKSRERLDFSTLLRLWWTRSGLTAWQGGHDRITWSKWRRALLGEAANIFVGKKHRLSDVLFLPQAYDKGKQEEIESEYEEFVANAMANAEKEGVGRLRVLAGMVKDVCDGVAGAKKLHLWHKYFSIVLPRDLADSYQEQARAGKTIEEERNRSDGQPSPWIFVLVLARPQRTENRNGEVRFWWKASEIAAITIHPRTAIPVESSYELQVAEALVAASRSFVKPFPGHAGELEIDGMTPDFVCIDRTPPIYLEIYGRMGDPEYASHTEEKRARYRRRGIKVWEWDTLQSQHLPDLPD